MVFSGLAYVGLIEPSTVLSEELDRYIVRDQRQHGIGRKSACTSRDLFVLK
jgi:hypothetical protein